MFHNPRTKKKCPKVKPKPECNNYVKKLKWRVESKLQDWKVLLACIGHHNSAGLSSPAAGVLCTPRGKTGQKMLAVWKPMSRSNTKVKRSELL